MLVLVPKLGYLQKMKMDKFTKMKMNKFCKLVCHYTSHKEKLSIIERLKKKAKWNIMLENVQ